MKKKTHKVSLAEKPENSKAKKSNLTKLQRQLLNHTINSFNK